MGLTKNDSLASVFWSSEEIKGNLVTPVTFLHKTIMNNDKISMCLAEAILSGRRELTLVINQEKRTIIIRGFQYLNLIAHYLINK